MGTYQITSSAGADMGTYEGATAREAVEAMWADAGVEGSDALFAELTVRAVREPKTVRCACGTTVAVEGEPEERIVGTCQGRPAWWYGCTDARHPGQAVAFGGYIESDGDDDEGDDAAPTYSIVSAGQYESLLNTRRSRHGHGTLDAAVAALAHATRHDDLVTVEIDGADEDLAPCAEWLVYADQEDADADDTGASAIAIIRRVRR